MKSSKKQRRINTNGILFILVLLIIGFGIYKYQHSTVSLSRNSTSNNKSDVESEINNLKDNEKNKPTSKEISAKITAVGDILFHQEQLDSAYNPSTDTYNFEDNYEFVKNYLSDSDFTLGTCETTFSGKEYGYSGYPLFNTPADALKSLKNIGFDMLSIASNHILDVTEPGFFNSLTALKNNGFDTLGARENLGDKNYSVVNINNIKVGFTSFCFETVQKYGNRAINSIQIPYALNGLINTYGSETLDGDLDHMHSTIENMRAEGAEFIIFVMHWGTEYSTTPSDEQELIAEKLNSYGVDVIIGSHPHVVQPLRKVRSEGATKDTIVFYSLGNFISNQREETMGNPLAENGALAQLELVKNTSGQVILRNYSYIPTWVYKYPNGSGKSEYRIMPTDDDSLSKAASTIPMDIKDKLSNSYETTTEIMND